MTYGNWEEISSFRVNSNNMNGSLPAQLGQLAKCVELFLNNNAFDSSIPAALGDLSSLLELNLANNLFAGQIPIQLGNLLTLRSLYVSTPLPFPALTMLFPGISMVMLCRHRYQANWVN